MICLAAAASVAVGLGACRAPGVGASESFGVDDSAAMADLPARRALPSWLDADGRQLQRGVFPDVVFAPGQARLSPAEERKLAPVAERLKSGGESLLLAGFTGDEGPAEYSRVLGEARACAVRAVLIRMGVSPERLHTLSFGQDGPASGVACRSCVQFGLVKSDARA